MLQAGYVFCTRCGHATSDAYYFNGELNIWVQLVRKFGGRFAVVKYTPPNLIGADEDLSDEADFTLVEEGRGINVLQHNINVECKIGTSVISRRFKRCCPFCVGKRPEWSDVNEIIPGMGSLPTYVIGVIGARTVGKSSWIHALSCAPNMNYVNSIRDNTRGVPTYILSAVTLADDRDYLPEATPVKSLGNTRIMKIVKREQGEPSVEVAHILVLDFAGELFSVDNKDLFDDSLGHIFRGGVGFSGVDAVVFMTEPNEQDQINPDTGRILYSLAETYNRVNSELNLLAGKPIAIVMNKVDKYFENPPKFKDTVRESSGEIPRLTRDTFVENNGAMYRKDILLSRVALENSLLKKIKPMVETLSNEAPCVGFLVKATAPFTDNGAEYVNFRDSINVMDPLLWILNKLDIFPIEDY